jgi:hypothetical protein
VIRFVILLAVVWIPLSWAADSKETQPKVIYKKNETHQFTGLKLKGQLKKPELSYIYKRKGLRSEKIVNIPEDFNEEIIQGAGKF